MTKRKKFNPDIGYKEQASLFKHSPALFGNLYSYVLRIRKLTRPIQDYLVENPLLVCDNPGDEFNPFKSLTAEGMRRNDLYKLVTLCRGNGINKRYMVDHEPIEGFWDMGKMTVLELQTAVIHAYALSHADMIKSLVNGGDCSSTGHKAMIESHGMSSDELAQDLGYTIKGYVSGDHADRYAYARALLPQWFEEWVPDDAWEAFVSYLCRGADSDRQAQIESDLEKASITLKGKRYQITELVHLGGNQYRITTQDELPGDDNDDDNPGDEPDGNPDTEPESDPDVIDNHDTAEKLANLFHDSAKEELESFISLVSSTLPDADSEALTPDLGFAQHSEALTPESEDYAGTMTPEEYQECLEELTTPIHYMKNPDKAPQTLESLVQDWAEEMVNESDDYLELPYHLQGDGKQWVVSSRNEECAVLVNVWNDSESIQVPPHWVDKYRLDPSDLDEKAPQLMAIIGDVMSDYGRLGHQFKGSPASLNSYIHKRELQAAVNMEVSERDIPNGYLAHELQEGIERAVKYNHILESMSDDCMVYAKQYPKSDWTEETESYHYEVFESLEGVRWRPVYCTPGHITVECELPRVYTQRIPIDSFRSGFKLCGNR